MASLSAEQVKSRLNPFFAARPEVSFAYLFGSVAKGSAGTLSDIDIAVFLDPLQLPREGGYGYQSELLVDLKAVLAGEVDLVILNVVSTILKFQVLKNGVLIYCRSEDNRRLFHENTVKTYLDLKPLLKVQNYYLHKRFAEGTFGGESAGRC